MDFKVVFPFTGKEIGGSHISAMTLMEEMLTVHEDACAIVGPSDSMLEQEARERSIPFYTYKPPATYSKSLIKSTQKKVNFLKAIGNNRQLIVHFNDIQALKSWLIPTKAAGAKTLYHHRSLNNMTWKKRLFLNKIDHIIAISEATQKNLDFLPNKKVSKLINAHELDFSFNFSYEKTAIKKELNLSEDSLIFGFLGNFWDRKRPIFFLQVAAHICQHIPHAHFVIYGREGDISQDVLAAVCETYHIKDRVSFMGFRMPPEKNLASVDTLLMPAIDEPFGRTLVEAAMAGIPYVATDSAGHSEAHRIFGGGRLIEQSASVKHFAEIAINTVLNSQSIINSKEKRLLIQGQVSKQRYFKNIQAIYTRTFS